jgi:MFS superfamily sulfate permease-like transporter
LEACILNASISNPFIPKLWTVLREDYGMAELKSDAAAGLTVAVVAFPLSMAIAIASGVTPDRGLSATVADSMTGARHRSSAELVAQGLVNIGSALFGGFCVTGTIARTAANIRAGARGPVAGMLHALFLLLFMLAAAPLAKFSCRSCRGSLRSSAGRWRKGGRFGFCCAARAAMPPFFSSLSC